MGQTTVGVNDLEVSEKHMPKTIVSESDIRTGVDERTAHLRTLSLSFFALRSRGGVGTETIEFASEPRKGDRRSGVEYISRKTDVSTTNVLAGRLGVSPKREEAESVEVEKGRTRETKRSSQAEKSVARSHEDESIPSPTFMTAEDESELEDEEEECRSKESASRSGMLSVAREKVLGGPS